MPIAAKGPRQRRSTSDTLCAVDQYAFDVGGGRRPGYEYPVPNVELRALAIRVVEVPKQRLFIALCIQTALASHPTTRVA
jgi:hypothetical protein